MTNQKIALGALIVLVVGILGGRLLFPRTVTNTVTQTDQLGGALVAPHTEIFKWSFYDGLLAGRTHQLQIDNLGNVTTTGGLSVGSLNVTGGLTVTGLTNNGNETIAGTLSVTGTSTLSTTTVSNLTDNGTLSVTGLSTLGNVIATSVTSTNLFATTTNFVNETATGVTTTNLAVTNMATIATATVQHQFIAGDGTSLAQFNESLVTGTGNWQIFNRLDLGETAGGSVFVTGTTLLAHLLSTSNAVPTVAVGGAGYAAGITLAGSTDVKGTVSSTVATANSGLITVNFFSAYTSAPVCVATPAVLNAQTDTYFVTSSISSFSINTPAGLTAGAHQWNYHCIQ